MIVYLQNHDATPYRDLILHACLNNVAYNTQMEGDRTRYLIQIINLTRQVDFYREQILSATRSINKEIDRSDAGQLLRLVCEFALYGDTEARQLVYDVFNSNLEDELGAGEIVTMDKLAGFLHIAEKLGEFNQQVVSPYVADYPLKQLEKEIGSQATYLALNKARRRNRNIDFYLTIIENRHKNQAQNREIMRDGMDQPYEYIKQCIQNRTPLDYELWGKKAREEDLLLAAQDLIQQDDPPHILWYLKIFLERPFPLDPRHLFSLIDFEDFRINRMMLSVISRVEHPSVRQFAMKLIHDGHEEAGYAIRLLASNYQDGDWDLINSWSDGNLDENTCYDLGGSIEAVFEHHPNTGAEHAMLNVYENTVHSWVRKSMIKMLHSIDALPDHIRQECFYDSKERIRELAQNNFERSD